MQREKISLWCERVIEAGWLLALTLIPIYFNLLSARHFEPDKATTLRSIVLIMTAFAIIYALERFGTKGAKDSRNRRPTSDESSSDPPAMTSTNPFKSLGQGLWNRLNRIPMAIPVLFYALVFLFTTLTSVVPYTSLWGSYQRLQGTYTNLSYIGLALLIVLFLRRREQLERIITISIITGLMVSFYGVVQHNGLDPLPWQGDVETRVASTMGNAIFVAAYLIMIVPFAMHRLIDRITAAERAPLAESNQMRTDAWWAVAYTLLILGTMAMLVAAIKFGAVVRVADFRYWWVFPGAVVVSTALWTHLSFDLQHRDRSPPIWPGALFIVYLLMLIPLYSISQGTELQQVQDTGGLGWGGWLLLSLIGIAAFYSMAFKLPRRAAPPTRLSLRLSAGGTGVILLSMLLTIFYSQSRGPWLGLSAGLFVFLSLSLWLARRRAIQQDPGSTLSQRLRQALIAWAALAIAGFAFIVVFNFSDAPFFNRLREIPYFGRAGQLFKSDVGTGLVRRLIWVGDEHVGGSVDLITANPFRTLVGWGPESMFVAFNPYYPPSLATIESRTASPDRAHQAMLDELITKGLLGLVSYFFVLISFATLCWRIIYHSKDWHWQVFAIACFSSVASHVVEGLTGIPIVSTLMMLWITFALTLIAGMMAGHYTLSLKDPEPEETTEAPPEEAPPEPEAEPKGRKSKRSGRKQSSKASGRRSGAAPAGRGAASARHRPVRPAGSGSGLQNDATALAFYGFLLVLSLVLVWWLNISTVYADMRFHEGENYSEPQNAGLNEQVVAIDKYLESIRTTPHEDFYYLNLGRSLMQVADARRTDGQPDGAEEPGAEVQDLLQLEDINEVAEFIQRQSPMALMSYARAVLDRARELNPLNKDHYANLARLHNFWYNWNQNVEKLRTAAEWYQEANKVAPYDVALINESGNVQLMLSNILASRGEEEEAQQYLDQAQALFEASQLYDPDYGQARARLAEIYRRQGNLEQAADFYITAIQNNPRQFDQQIESIARSFASQPDLLLKIRDAYAEQAVSQNEAQLYSIAGLLSVRADDLEGSAEAYQQAIELAPNHIGNRLNYSIVLSDTENYTQALVQAQEGLALAQEDGETANVQRFQTLVSILAQKVADE